MNYGDHNFMITLRSARVELCCSTSSTQQKCMGSTRRTCQIVSSQDATSKVEIGLLSELM